MLYQVKAGRGASEVTLDVVEVSRQRNGISGKPFWTIVFDFDAESTHGVKRFVATFGEDDRITENYRGRSPRNPDVRVLALDDEGRLLPARLQSWRGDYFHVALDKVVRIYEDSVSLRSVPRR